LGLPVTITGCETYGRHTVPQMEKQESSDIFTNILSVRLSVPSMQRVKQ